MTNTFFSYFTVIAEILDRGRFCVALFCKVFGSTQKNISNKHSFGAATLVNKENTKI